MKSYIKSFIKTLTASDIDSTASNQHELHGVKKLEAIFGVIPHGVDGRDERMATLKIGSSDRGIPIKITWYNARASNPNRHEYRLYYCANSDVVMNQRQAGDDVFIGEDSSGHIDIIIFPGRCSGHSDWTSLD